MTDEHSSLEKRVKEILEKASGLKAKSIADRLGVDRRYINSLLYGNLRNAVVSDSSYRWYLRKDAPDDAKAEDEVSDTPLSSLCRYYLDCLTHDDSEGVSAFATSKYDLDYFELDEWPFGPAAENPFSQDEAQKLVGRAKKERFAKSLFFGFPVFVRRIESPKGVFHFVEPVFLFSCESNPTDRFALPSIQGDLPWLNLKALDALPTDSGDSTLQESIRLSEALGLNEPGRDPAEFDEVASRLRSESAGWPWIEDPHPYDLNSNPPLTEVTSPGLYNRAVLIIGKRSQYTWGLETELNKLMRLEQQDYEGTALGEWIKLGEHASPAASTEPLLEVLPLNSEQREATQRGLENDLTVVTGPPGTGKSQVVTSLLVNAAWQETKVLFASRNNKAVDVVEERVNALGPRPVLLRLGNMDYQRDLAEYLTGLLSAKATATDQECYEEAQAELEDVRSQYDAMQDRIEQLIELRNETDTLEREAEEARNLLGDSPFRAFAHEDLGNLEQRVDVLGQVATRARRSDQSGIVRLFWFAFRRRRQRALEETARDTKEILETLGLERPQSVPSDESIHEWMELVSVAKHRVHQAKSIKAYFKSLERLREMEALEDLEREQFELTGRMSAVSREVWKKWLKLQPDRLSRSDRQLLGEYATQIKLLVAASENSSRAAAKVYRRYYELFPEITKFLPCWAVTNLTARRIPFEPGFFDVVVIDEASQCDIASALPLLYRSKHAVIIGDPKQLRHIAGIAEKQDQLLLDKHELTESYMIWSYSVNSLYDLASQLCRSEDVVALRDHHRSHSDIISFSNEHFYEQSLRVATRYDRLRLREGEPALRWIDVRGKVIRPGGRSALNEREAEAVVQELKRVVLEQQYPGTIGVVTPFRAHANRIRDLVASERDLTRSLSGRDFIPDTAHAFQGDERDLMIFSPVVSPGISDPALWFLRNNAFLFNVAITRARAALIVVGSESAARDSGVDYLEAFVEYVNEIERSSQERGQQSFNFAQELASLGPEYPAVRHPERVSDWERLFYKVLYQEGVQTIPQYQIEQYALDLALFDDGRKLDIEVDGERYHRRWDGELVRRDQLRNFRLIELGWDVMRFWVYEIRDCLPDCVERVKNWKDGD